MGVKATMTGQRMQLYAETNLADHVSAAHSNAFMNMVSTHLRIPNNMQLIMQYLVPFSVTQVECERSFSTLKFITNRLRSNIGQEKLEALMLTYMKKQMVSHISNEEIINQFTNSFSARRRLLMP